MEVGPQQPGSLARPESSSPMRPKDAKTLPLTDSVPRDHTAQHSVMHEQFLPYGKPSPGVKNLAGDVEALAANWPHRSQHHVFKESEAYPSMPFCCCHPSSLSSVYIVYTKHRRPPPHALNLLCRWPLPNPKALVGVRFCPRSMRQYISSFSMEVGIRCQQDAE